jgi:hypothetical protein
MRQLTTIVTSVITFFATIACACDSNRAVTSASEMRPNRKHCCNTTQGAQPDRARHEHKQGCAHCRPIISAFAKVTSSVFAPAFHAWAIPLSAMLNSSLSSRAGATPRAPHPPALPAPTLLRQQCALAL